MKNYSSNFFNGRIGRKNYILGLLFITASFYASVIPLGLIERFTGGVGSAIFDFSLYPLVTVYLALKISLHIRRLHDLGNNAFFVLLLPLTIWLNLFMKGQKTANKYGEVPSEDVKFFDVVLNLNKK